MQAALTEQLVPFLQPRRRERYKGSQSPLCNRRGQDRRDRYVVSYLLGEHDGE